MTNLQDRAGAITTNTLDRFGVGFASGVALHLIFQGPVVLWAVYGNISESTDRYYTALLILAFIGATQFLYLFPVWLIAFLRGRRNFAMGTVALFGLTILVNGGCWVAAVS